MLNIANKSSFILRTGNMINIEILSKVNILQYLKADEIHPHELYTYLNEYTFMNSVNISY